MNEGLKTIRLARHYGFCMGVKRAIRTALRTGADSTGPVNVIHDIVHNDAVVKSLAERKVGSVASVAEAPGGTIIVPAHGAPPALFEEAERRGLKIVDATCPLVIKIQRIVRRLIDNGYEIIHFGDLHHDETRAVVGQAPDGKVVVIHDIDGLRALPQDRPKLALTSQTTADAVEFARISREAKRLFPNIKIYNTICNATGLRQKAVLELAPEVDLMLIVGSRSSANSKRLRDISQTVCKQAYLINSARDIDPAWLEGVTAVGVTAGASTPDILAEEVVTWLMAYSGGKAVVIRPGDRNDEPADLDGAALE
ncbi:MAG: 4-hydroxy-3-methylbut-2-enyl diphosphate reductase [candidate division Zixibacteria bacterium]|nr:4-hydroxy-3-methylbut-2-enyl diphosphate reductase [candidate division Zixibacteria bacterium]